MWIGWTGVAMAIGGAIYLYFAGDTRMKPTTADIPMRSRRAAPSPFGPMTRDEQRAALDTYPRGGLGLLVVPEPIEARDRMRVGMTPDGHTDEATRWARQDAAGWTPGGGIAERIAASRDEVVPSRRLPAITAEIRGVVPEHVGADEAWGDTLRSIVESDDKGSLRVAGEPDPDIEAAWMALSDEDVAAAQWGAELEEWDKESARDFRKLDDVLEAERRRVLEALVGIVGPEMRELSREMDRRDADLSRKVELLVLIAMSADTQEMEMIDA